MSSAVLDASALLALLQAEPGSDTVAEAVAAGAAIGTVNLSEAVAKLVEAGVPDATIPEVVDALVLEVVDFDTELAYRAGRLRRATQAAGLSFGDRACLALAQRLGLPALTADRRWSRLALDVAIRQIR
ncbi:MAG TPA: type II toxin-antitoxin system VapC family toxin [Chloroflexota bacterium]|nr:type II toxin-antitoxin system VapC family toxin [Chloroflexota bacterium]